MLPVSCSSVTKMTPLAISCREVMQAYLERFDLVALSTTLAWPLRHLAATGAGTTAAGRFPFNSPCRSAT
jgi:hypothetical protein